MSWKNATRGLVLVAALLGAFTLGDYGLTWDEAHSLQQGERFLAWYSSGFHDRRVLTEGNYWVYGGLVNGPAVWVHRVSGADVYETLNAITLMFGIAGLALAGWVGSRLAGPAAGFLSAGFLWLTPAYYGHSFNNAKDLPFAVSSLAVFAAVVWVWPRLSQPRWSSAVVLGTAVGISMSIRIAGLLGFAWIAAACGGWLLLEASERGLERATAAAARQLSMGAWAVLIAWALMLVWWPYAQLDPVRNPVRGLLALGDFQDYMNTVRFRGADMLAETLPRTYVPVSFGVTLPEFYFAAAALGAVAALRGGLRGLRTRAARETAVLYLVLAATALAPVGLVVYRRSILYDGVRHLLFVVPPLAVLAGCGVAAFFSQVRSRGWRVATAALLAGTAALTAADMVRLHPYESVYFNRLVAGGLPGAFGQFETDYWGQSYREGVQWLVRHPPPSERPLTVANCSAGFLTAHELERSGVGMIPVGLDQHPDIVLATTRWSCHQRYKGEVLHVVERLGVPLCYVIDLRHAASTPDAPRRSPDTGPPDPR